MKTATEFGPEEIRALRGERSRAAFAALLGVTPLTIYRWELPDGAAQARRPRGAVLTRLKALASGLAPGAEGGSAAPSPALAGPPTAPAAAGVCSEEELVLPSLERLVRGDWRQAEAELLELHLHKRLNEKDARALAAAGLAQ